MDIGIALGGAFAELPDFARRAEDSGFESVWCAETARTAYLQAAGAIHGTHAATIGTAIALAFPRSPAITAMAARDLAELSGDRFILGLGSQVKRVNEQRFGVPFEHPAPKMGEYVEAVRAVLASFDGQPPDRRGRFYEITMPPFPGAASPAKPIPIYLAAVNERMLETAGRVGDGIVGHPMNSPKYLTEIVRPAIERGARAAGRDPSEVSVTTNLIVQIAPDRDTARQEAAMQVAFYATTRTYAPVLAMHGFDDRIPSLREAYAAGDFGRMSDLALPISDQLALAGEPDEVRERLTEFEGIADRVIVGGAWIGRTPERLRESYQLLLETFGRS